MTRRSSASVYAAAAVVAALALAGSVAQQGDPLGRLRAVHSPGAIVDDMHIASLHCHIGLAAGGALPDPRCTPGGYDPAVSQATIQKTICKPGWATSVRPSSSRTRTWEKHSDTAYGVGSSGEYDHLIPLELGGSNATSNLWPEPGGIPNPKDAVEASLKRQVCAGAIPLNAARIAIAADWTTATKR